MSIKHLISDIRFWIVVFFIVRLVGITDPPLEVGHNWRQTTVTMVSRNFYEINNNIFYPRIDFAGEKTGITGMEFPMLNYIIYLVAEVFGYQHWYGRLINLLISSFGLWFFYILIKKYFSSKTAFYSTIILSVSIWFQFSRKIMPDTFSMSLIFAAIYCGSEYLDNPNIKKKSLYLFGYFILTMAGVLSKLPSGYLLIVFAMFLFDKRIALKNKILFSFVSVLALVPVSIWYFYWVPYLVETFKFWHFFMGKSLAQGINEISTNLNTTLGRFYETALKFIGFATFLYGLIMSIVHKNWKLIVIFVLTLISFSIIIFKAGLTFFHHDYYIVPFVPVMALIAGVGLTKIKNKSIALIILIAISVESIANQAIDFKIYEADMALLNLDKDLNSISNKNDLIIINSGKFPTPMYFTHRKGWINTNEEIKNEKYIVDLKSKGLKYIVILKRSFGTEMKLPQYNLLLNNKDYSIYKL